MSTNALVAYLRSDGSIVSSYVHYDGYVTGVGETLLEHYNTDSEALGISVAGYFSSLDGDWKASLESSVHTEEPVMFDSKEEFDEYLLENSHLEFAYLWSEGHWRYASWSTKVEGIGRYAEYSSTWNGWHDLIPAYVREGRKMIDRFRDIALEDNRDTAEYAEMADATEAIVDKWHRIGMAFTVKEFMAA